MTRSSKHHRRLVERRAFSLIELMVVISLWAAVITVLALVLGRLMHLSGTIDQVGQQQVNLARLERQFLADVREATSLERSAAGALVRISVRDHQVDYEQHDNDIERLESRGAEVIRREGYRLRSDSSLSVKVEERESGLIVLTVAERTAAADEHKPKALVVARLGAEHRFERPDGSRGDR
jgi:hypothetical protein